MKKVLFVCTANLCRSPMAQAILNTLSEDECLHFEAESAGTAALEGEPMAPNAVVVLEEAGIYPGAHHARQVSAAMIEAVELVLAMGTQHAADLYRLPNGSPADLLTLREYATGVPDRAETPDS